MYGRYDYVHTSRLIFNVLGWLIVVGLAVLAAGFMGSSSEFLADIYRELPAPPPILWLVVLNVLLVAGGVGWKMHRVRERRIRDEQRRAFSDAWMYGVLDPKHRDCINERFRVMWALEHKAEVDVPEGEHVVPWQDFPIGCNRCRPRT